MGESAHYDCIVIGSGQGGNPLVSALAKAGRKTALVERKHVGGTCINEGCTPTKTMVASARVAYLARRGPDYGVSTGPVEVDLTKVRERKRAIVESFRGGSEKRLKSTENLELIFGDASFTGQKAVRVARLDGGEMQMTADAIFLNTGTRAVVPPLRGIDGVPFLDNVSIMELDRVPEHLLVLGGGYIGVEFAQMFRRFGSRVTIVQSGPQLLGREDADIAGEAQKILEQDGIRLLLNAKAEQVLRQGDEIRLEVNGGAEGRMTITGSHLLVAVGRRPNTDTLNPGAAGIDIDEHGNVRVNEYLETSAAGVYALGDVKGGPAFTHISYDDYRIAKANYLDGKRATTRGRMVPYTVFMDPQLGRIGMTEQEARDAGRKIRVAKMPMSYVARALEMDESRGLMKMVVDAESEQILGAAVLGIEGGEMASMLQIAMMGKLPYTALRDGTFSHPTLSESLNNVFSNFTDES
jgi:pyruvate/2-oxoglutarate dehydrogenase complex dihydrolipoamide dehydrogenase (E3) component